MSIEHPSNTQDTPGEDSTIDTASQERLAWRVGGEEPTAQALELDARLAGEVAEQVDARRAEKDAIQQKLERRLGGTAGLAEDISQE